MPARVRMRGGGAAGATLLLGGASLLLFWPGIALYDSVAQYGQVLAGRYDDWHPPAMARLWAVAQALAGPGAAPMFALQMALYWLGLGLMSAALARGGRRIAAGAVLAIGAWPPFLGWQAAVLKDAQLTGAVLAAVGIVAWWRLAGRAVPRGAWAAVGVLLGYATLVRANAVFATVPLAVMLAGRGGGARQAVTALAGIVAVLAVSGPVNHALLAASRSGVERTEAIYDLAGIAVRTGDAAATGIDADAIATLRARRCVKPFFWDPLGEPDRCNAVVQPLRAVAPGALYARLAGAALRHPLAYLAHRLAHLNSTERWLVPARWPSAAPPEAPEPNEVGLVAPTLAARDWQRWAGRLVDVPLAWPVAWVVVAATALALAARRGRAPARDLALALATSALVLEASFAVLSIASDLRYHLWAMIAAALAAMLLADGRRRPAERRVLVVGGVVLAVVVVAGLAARAVLPTPPVTYAGMIAA